MFRFVSNVAAEVSSNDAVPRWVVFLVEFFLDVGSDILFYVIFFHCLKRSEQELCICVQCFWHFKFIVVTLIFFYRKAKSMQWRHWISICDISNDFLCRDLCLPNSLSTKLNISLTWVEQSTASCCISSDISAFLITAFLSVILLASKIRDRKKNLCKLLKLGLHNVF